MLEGKGLVERAEIRGVRGVLDRRKCWNEYDEEGDLIPFDQLPVVPPDERWRSEWYKGSFHLRHCLVSDVEIQLLQPEPKRPLHLVIHSLHSTRLRRQFLAYDLLCSTVEGSLDNRLFSLRPPKDLQIEGFLVTHFNINGMDVDLAKAGGATGPLSWMTRGRIDVDSLFYMPKDYVGEPNDTRKVHVRVKMQLTHLNARVPLGDQEISYLNAALVQPMVVFLNTNYVAIPIDSWLSIPIRYYNGAWSPYGACMTDALSEAVGVELSRKVADQKRPKNLLWMLIKGVDGVWRACKYYTTYILWYGYLF